MTLELAIGLVIGVGALAIGVFGVHARRLVRNAGRTDHPAGKQ